MTELKKPVEPKTPELEKMKGIRERSQAIGGFLEWLSEKEILLCVRHHHQGNDDPDEGEIKGCWAVHEHTDNCFRRCKTEVDNLCGYSQDQLASMAYQTEVLLARYFEIDLKKADEERESLLDYVRAMNEYKEKGGK